jgi:SAM-dependent methyltransferase
MAPVSEILTRFAGPNWEEDPAVQAYLLTVDKSFKEEREQHPMRRWEYASALAARGFWMQYFGDIERVHTALDVGGAGSPFVHMIRRSPLWRCRIVDPEVNQTIEEVAGINEHIGEAADAIFSLSVLEHVEDLEAHLDALTACLRSKGLLFITVDAWDPPVDAEHAPDKAHFHWMRKRIFNPKTIAGLMEALRLRGFMPFGGIDLEYKGNTVYDYTFASVAMLKE